MQPKGIRIFMIAEAPPADLKDGFYAGPDSFYMQTTLDAFSKAGHPVSSMQDIVDLGVYITTAIKCAKTGYGVSLETIENCSQIILEKELSLFPDIKVYLLMGDVAIKAMNRIVKRATGKPLIPSGPTYKIRKGTYFYNGDRPVIPSYLMTGKSYLIEKSKQKMIAEDIKHAIDLSS